MEVGKRKRIFASGIVVLVATQMIFAQIDSAKLSYLEMPLEELLSLNVTTASKTLQKSSDAPATIYVINEEQIAIRGYTSLEEVLEDIPEIEIQKKASVEYSNYFTIRGIDGTEKFIILMDGMRINSPAGTPLPIVHNYGIADAKQIEIILGPASSIYGVDAFTGVVNIITKKGSEAKFLNVNTSGGLYSTTDNSLVFGIGDEDISLLLSGNYYFSEEPYFPDYFEEEYEWLKERYLTNGELQFLNGDIKTIPIRDYRTPTNAYSAHAKLNIKDFEIGYFRNLESHSSSFSTKPEYTVYSDETILKEIVESMYASYSYESKNKKWIIQSTLSHSKDEIDPQSNYINVYTSFDKGYKYAYNKTLKIEEQITRRINDVNSIIVGFTYEDFNSLAKTSDLPFPFDRDVTARLQNQYYLGTNVTDTAGNDLTIYQDFYYLQYRNFGSYLQFHYYLTNKLALTLGGRYDFNTRYEFTINPRVGLILSPSNKLNIKLLYGMAYLAPSPYRSYQHYGSFIPVTDSVSGEVVGLTAGFWRLPKPELNPQNISTYEASCSYFLNNNMAVTVNGFLNFVDDIISSTGDTGRVFHDIPVGWVEWAANKGSAKSYGGTARLDIKYNLSNIDLSSYLAYTYVDGDINGGHLPFSAKNTFKFGIDLRYNKFSLSPRGIYRTESTHRSLKDADGNFVTNAPFLLINLATRYTLTETEKLKSVVFVKITNLLNSKYYNLPIGGRESIPNTPQDPIRINIGANIQF